MSSSSRSAPGGARHQRGRGRAPRPDRSYRVSVLKGDATGRACRRRACGFASDSPRLERAARRTGCCAAPAPRDCNEPAAASSPLLMSPFVLAELDYLLATRVGLAARMSLLTRGAATRNVLSDRCTSRGLDHQTPCRPGDQPRGRLHRRPRLPPQDSGCPDARSAPLSPACRQRQAVSLSSPPISDRAPAFAVRDVRALSPGGSVRAFSLASSALVSRAGGALRGYDGCASCSTV